MKVRTRSAIRPLTSRDGTVLQKREEIIEVAGSFDKSLLGTSYSASECGSIPELSQMLDSHISG